MTERDVYDLARVRVDPMDRDALRGELVDRARRANDLAHYPTAGRDQEQAQEHIDGLLRRSDSDSGTVVRLLTGFWRLAPRPTAAPLRRSSSGSCGWRLRRSSLPRKCKRSSLLIKSAADAVGAYLDDLHRDFLTMESEE
jgi:hypothetical protein